MADVRQPLATRAALEEEAGLRASGNSALADLLAAEAAARAAADDLRALLTDPRFTDARPPTGGAGGVLSGGYPDPGFAVDMAEQSELQTEITNRAADVDAEEAARIAADALKANDADVVKLTGNQTVAGIKTFSSAPVVPASSFPESATTGLVADLAAKETPAGAQSKVEAAIAALLDSAPGTLDTLNELAAALGDDPNFATTLTNALALKAPIASPTFTGTVTLPGDPGSALVAAPKQYVDTQAAAAQGASQPADTDLGVIAALTPTNDDLMQRKAGAWANRTPAQVITDLVAGPVYFKEGRPWADVRAWGALTNGTDAATTTAAILAANAAVNALGGGTLYFGGPSSVYLINAPIPLRANVHYKFEPGATLKSAPATQFIQMLGTDVANVTISDPTLDGNKANQTDDGSDVVQVGIYFNATTTAGVTNCKVERHSVKNFWGQGIIGVSTAATNPLELDVLDGKITNCKRGMFINRPTDCNVLRNRCWANLWDGIWVGNGVNNATNKTSASIRGNKVWKNGHHGIVANLALNNFDISDNHSWQNGWNGSIATGPYYGIVVSEGCKDFGIHDNHCWGNPGNITIDPVLTSDPTALQVVRAVVEGNACLDATELHGINLNKPETIAVVGNICSGNFLSGIAGQAKHVLVDGNELTNNAAYGLAINASGGVGSDWTIGANHYAGNALGEYVSSGSPANIRGTTVGPTSATADRVATFDGTSGRLIKDSGLEIVHVSATRKTLKIGGAAVIDLDSVGPYVRMPDATTKLLWTTNGFLDNADGTAIFGTTQGKVRANVTGVGLNGNAPVAKAAAITSPTAPGVVYVQAEAAAMKTAVDAIRVALTNIGITL